ncbi:unnamed protein product [Moneuplotes crassus]|uniref:chitin synthase n=2 Tax=Euplotes crassus TaxID=5936 RepID=A0AAD1XA96_EUPCR|nr:unnamed protein product [Moneuplotes crassus]
MEESSSDSRNVIKNNQVLPEESVKECYIEDYDTELKYLPLTMVNNTPNVPTATNFELRLHRGGACVEDESELSEDNLPEKSLIQFAKDSEVKLAICITQYNEPIFQLAESLAGIYRSYYELVNIDESYKDRVHICIISDGIEKLDPQSYLSKLEDVGIFNTKEIKDFKDFGLKDGNIEIERKYLPLSFINKNNMNDKERKYGSYNVAHTFSKYMDFNEWMSGLDDTKQDGLKIDNYDINDFLLGNDTTGKVKHKKFKHLKMPIHFMIKHRNQGKIESHKWFFKGFCAYTNPTFAQIIDCGSIPLWNSISHIIMHMECFETVGGACGEIECMVPEKKEDYSGVSFIEGAIIRAQYVEYKVSHYLDKATESLFGFVSVLPGAFSTFRWDCIRGIPLDTFLLGAKDEFSTSRKIVPCYKANKYLAEDRIMCLEIIAKAHENFIIHYIPGAKCLTDPPMSLTGLLKQRRRWFNGSMFATFHVLFSMGRICKRKTFFPRFFGFATLYIYMMANTFLSFILVGLFYGAFSIFIRKAFDNDECYNLTKPANIIENIYLIFLATVLMLSITVDVKWAETGYRMCSFGMGCFAIVMLVATIIYATQEDFLENYAIIFVCIWFLSYVLPLALNVTKLRTLDFIKGIIYSLFMSPTYVNIFTIFAISNIHDVSWGSRPAVYDPLSEAAEKRKVESYKNFRSNFLVCWILCNLITGSAIITLSRNGNDDVIFYIGAVLGLVLAVKIFLSFLHFCVSLFHSWMTNRHIKKKKSSVFKEVQDSKIEEEETKFIEYVKMTPAEKELHKKKENELANNLKKNILGLAIKKIKSQHPKKKRVADLAEIEVEGVNVKDLYMKMSTMKRSGKAAAELYESASEAATPKRRNGIEETSFDSHDFPSSDEDEFNDLNVREDSKLLDITPDPSPTKVKFGKSQDGNSKKHKNPMKPKSILKKSDNKPEIDPKSSLKKKVKSKEENKIFEASFESESDSTQSEHNAKPKMSRKATGREINMNDKKINFTPQEESYSTINDHVSTKGHSSSPYEYY